MKAVVHCIDFATSAVPPQTSSAQSAPALTLRQTHTLTKYSFLRAWYRSSRTSMIVLREDVGGFELLRGVSVPGEARRAGQGGTRSLVYSEWQDVNLLVAL